MLGIEGGVLAAGVKAGSRGGAEAAEETIAGYLKYEKIKRAQDKRQRGLMGKLLKRD